MKLDGTFTISAPPVTVWTAIRDPGLMAQCVPGCESAEKITDDSYRAVVSVKVGPVSARFNLVIDIEEEQAPDFVRSIAKGEEGSRASMLSSKNLLSLKALSDGVTEVSWSADVNVTGRLGKYGLGLMRKKAESLSAEFVQAFARRVEAGGMVA